MDIPKTSDPSPYFFGTSNLSPKVVVLFMTYLHLFGLKLDLLTV